MSTETPPDYSVFSEDVHEEAEDPHRWVNLDPKHHSIAERRPYEVCPNCGRGKYRPVARGIQETQKWECKECHHEEPFTGEVRTYVHDPKPMADLLFVLLAAGAVAFLGWAVLTLGGLI